MFLFFLTGLLPFMLHVYVVYILPNSAENCEVLTIWGQTEGASVVCRGFFLMPGDNVDKDTLIFKQFDFMEEILTVWKSK